MIKYHEKTRAFSFTGKEAKLIYQYAKEHKLTFKDVVYLALINGIAAGYFNKSRKK